MLDPQLEHYYTDLNQFDKICGSEIIFWQK